MRDRVCAKRAEIGLDAESGRGVERLRVIDASVMPTVTSANTNAASLMIGERGARLVLQDG